MLLTKDQYKEAKREQANRMFRESLKENPDAIPVWDGKIEEAIGDGCDYENSNEFLVHRLKANGWSLDKLFKKEISLDDLLAYLDIDPEDFFRILSDGIEDKLTDFVKDNYGA